MLRMVLGLVVFVFLFIYITLLNPQAVEIKLYKTLSYTVPVSSLVIICFTVGFVVSYIISAFRDLVLSFRTSSLEKRLKQQNNIKGRLLEAVKISEFFSEKEALAFLKRVGAEGDSFLKALYAEFLRKEDLEKARKIHAELKKEEESPFLQYELLSDLYAEGRYSEVVSIVEDTKDASRSPLLLYLGILSAKKIGNLDLALSLAEKLYKLCKGERTKSLLLGLKAERSYKKGDVSGLKKILKSDPAFLPAAIYLVELGDVAHVIKALKTAYRRTKDVTFLLFLVDLMVKKEGVNPDRVIKFISDIAGGEGDKRLSLVLAYLYSQVGMYDEALKLVNEVGDEGKLSMAVRIRALKGLKRFEECCLNVESLLDSASFRYVCRVCRGVHDNLAPVCSFCGSYNSVRAEVL